MALSQLFIEPQSSPANKPECVLRQQLSDAAHLVPVTKKNSYQIDSAETLYLLPFSDNLMLNRINGVSFGIRLPQHVLWPIEPEPEVELVVRSNGHGKVGILCQPSVNQLMHRSIEMRFHILKSLLTSSTYLASELEQYACNTLTGRIANLLVTLSEVTANDAIYYSHSQLAGLLNAQRESVSMIIGQFRRNGWVETSYGCITILDCLALRRLATNY